MQVDKASVSPREAVLSVAQRGRKTHLEQELDAGFAQEDLTIYDRRDKTEVERKTCDCGFIWCTTQATPPSLLPFSAVLEHPRAISLAPISV